MIVDIREDKKAMMAINAIISQKKNAVVSIRKGRIAVAEQKEKLVYRADQERDGSHLPGRA